MVVLCDVNLEKNRDRAQIVFIDRVGVEVSTFLMGSSVENFENIYLFSLCSPTTYIDPVFLV